MSWTRANGQQVGNKPEDPSPKYSSEKHSFPPGGLVIPGALQQNAHPSRVGTMESHMDLLGTQYRAMGFCLECLPPYNQNLLPKV